MAFIHSDTCPCCGASTLSKKLLVKDHSISRQAFEIWECAACTLRFTQDFPDAENAGNYYQSDAYISHTDTRNGLVNQLYHFVRKRTLQKKRKLLQRITGLEKASLLDIGAGTGAFAAIMAAAGWQVTGLEPDSGARQRAQALNHINLQDSPALFTLGTATYDAITLWHVLEHVHALHPYLEQMKNLLKQQGKIFIAVPNYTSYDASIYQQYWAAYDVPRHLYHFSPQSMEKLLEQHGLKLKRVLPMWYDSFYISLLSERIRNGKGNFIRAIGYGLLSNLVTLTSKKRCSSLIYIIEKA